MKKIISYLFGVATLLTTTKIEAHSPTLPTLTLPSIILLLLFPILAINAYNISQKRPKLSYLQKNIIGLWIITAIITFALGYLFSWGQQFMYILLVSLLALPINLILLIYLASQSWKKNKSKK